MAERLDLPHGTRAWAVSFADSIEIAYWQPMPSFRPGVAPSGNWGVRTCTGNQM